MIKFFAFITLLIVSLGCNENPTKTELKNGKVYITSNVKGAEILVDDKPTGKVVPDTLELLALSYKIKVRHSGYFSSEKEVNFPNGGIKTEHFELTENNLVKNVLLEYFYLANNELQNEATLIQDSQIKIIQFPAPTSTNSIIEHTNFNDVQERINTYSQFNFPAIFLDGRNVSRKELDSLMEIRKLKETKLTLTVNDSLLSGNLLRINIFIDVYDTDQVDFENLSLHSMIYENNLRMNISETQNEIDYLFREFVDGVNGTSLRSINQKGRARYSFQKIVDPYWAKENLNILAFVQNTATKEIIQTTTNKVYIEN